MLHQAITEFIWGIKMGFNKSYTEGYVRAVRERGREDLATTQILKYENLRRERRYPPLDI